MPFLKRISVQIRKRFNYQFDYSASDNEQEIWGHIVDAFPTTENLIKALTPFRACRFKLPETLGRTRYDEITRELFDDYMFGNLRLPLSYVTARQVFEEILIDDTFSSALVRIVAGFGDSDDHKVIYSMICNICLDNFQKYNDFIKRFPEFAS